MGSAHPEIRTSGGTWQQCEAYVRNSENTAWIKVWPLSTHTVSFSPAQINSQEPNGNTAIDVTAVVNGGTGPFSYAWSWQSGGANMTLTNTTSATVTVSASGNNQLRTGVLQCVVTDTGNGNLAVTETGNVSIQFGTPA